MTTPHLSAAPGDFAKTVLMPGDPLRARRVATKFLDDVRVVSEVRGATAFTGTYKDTPVSVMPSGMGMPSAAIYVTELFREYDVARVIRIGTCGAYQKNLKLLSIIAADRAETHSVIPEMIGAPEELLATPALVEAAKQAAETAQQELHIGTLFSSDVFYEPTDATVKANTAQGVLAVEMEAAAMYAIAAVEGREALALVTVSDHIQTGEQIPSQQRQQGVDTMLELALETTVIAAAND